MNFALPSVLATFIFLFSAAPAQEIGVNAAVRNDVGITSAGADSEAAAEVGGDVRLRDKIRSGDDSALQVLLKDETTFTVGANAELEVTRFIYDPDRGAEDVAGSVTKGTFRLVSGKKPKRCRKGDDEEREEREDDDADGKCRKDTSVDTPVANIGVRGTIVEGAVGEEEIATLGGLDGVYFTGDLSEDATLVVLRGPERDANNLNRPGSITVTSGAGESLTLTRSNSAVIVPGGGRPIIGPFLLPKATLRSFGQRLGTVPSADPDPALPQVTFLPIPSLDKVGPDELFLRPEDEGVIDRPLQECFLLGDDDGIPVTDGGLILDGSPDSTFDDFGSFEGGACFD